MWSEGLHFKGKGRRFMLGYLLTGVTFMNLPGGGLTAALDSSCCPEAVEKGERSLPIYPPTAAAFHRNAGNIKCARVLLTVMLKQLANFSSCFQSELVLESNLLRLREKSSKISEKTSPEPFKESRKIGNFGGGSLRKEFLDEIYIFACVYNIVIT